MLQAALALIQVLGGVARRDTDNSRAQGIADVLGIAEYFISEGAISVQKLQQLENTVKAMADEGRDPTTEELAMLRARSDAAHDAIQDVDLGQDDGSPAPETADTGDSGANPAANTPVSENAGVSSVDDPNFDPFSGSGGAEPNPSTETP